MLSSTYSDEDAGRFTKLLSGVRNNDPGSLPRIDMPANSKRRLLRDLGFNKGSTFLHEIPIAGLPTVAVDAIERYFRKLVLALYYRELASIAPPTSIVGASVIPNATLLEPAQFKELIAPFRFTRLSKFQNRDISEQFAYRCDLGLDGALFGTLIRMHRNVVGIACVCNNPALITEPDLADWYDLRGNIAIKGTGTPV